MAYFEQGVRASDLKSRLFFFISRDGVFGKSQVLKLIVRWTALLSIFAYLLFKLSVIGWAEIINSLPTSTLFYVLSITFVFLPILAEKIVYQIATTTKPAPPFKLFVRKHVINKAVMNYAGEGYFLQQLSRLNGLNLTSAAIIVKDLTIVRTFAANFWVISLVLFGLILGNFNVFNKIATVSPALFLTICIVSLGFCIGIAVFFRKLTRLSFNLAGKIASIYLLRSFLAACILVAQWNLILPGTSLAVWAMFLIVFFIAKKSPVGGDLVFVSVALTLPGLAADNAAIAAMFLTMAAVNQLIYSVGLVTTSDFSVNKRDALPEEGFDKRQNCSALT